MPTPLIITPEREDYFKEIFPDHTWKEVRDLLYIKYGVTIARKAVYTTAKRLGVTKVPNHKRDIMHRNAVSERRRILFGLPQKTKMHVVYDADNVYKRRRTKSNIIRTNNYFSEPRSRSIYYDGNTKRSHYLEKKYASMFEFLPAEGFNPDDSVWVDTYNNKWKVSNL